MSWRNLRSISSDPLSNFLSKLSQDQILRESQEESAIGGNLEEDRFKGVITHSILEIRSLPQPFVSKIPVNRVFLTPLEPDWNRCRFWCKFDSGADTMTDYSYFGNEIKNVGYMLPVPISSPSYDEGIVGGQIAMQYNNTDSMPKSARVQFGSEVAYTRVNDNTNIRLSSYLDGTLPGYDGFSISMLVRTLQVYMDTNAAGSEAYHRRFCYKIDNTTNTYAYEVRSEDDGTLVIIFRKAGTDYCFYVDNFFPLSPGADFRESDFKSADFRTRNPVTGVTYDTPLSNVDNIWYRIDIIFKFSDNTLIVRKDGVAQTVVSTSGLANWPADPVTHTKDLMINAGRFGTVAADGILRPIGVGINEWADFRIYGGQLTSSESTHLFTNKYTIADIAFGCVALSGYTPQSAPGAQQPDLTRDPFGVIRMFPTKAGGNEWFSVSWSNGQSRTIESPPILCSPDVYDGQFFVNRSGSPKVTIQGNGITKVDTASGTGSPRMTVLTNAWKNVESTVYMRCPTLALSGMELTIRAKTNHYCVQENEDDPLLFGGYNFTVDYTNQRVNLRREISHITGYSDRQAIVNQTLPANQWIGIKCILYNTTDGKVKLEMYRDDTNGLNGGTWTKITEAVDDGTWGGPGVGTPPVRSASQGSAIRADIGVFGGYIEIKNWSIREINHPLMDPEIDEED